MSYPKNPENIIEALITLSEFAKTAPGRLPERIEIAIKIADELKTNTNKEIQNESRYCSSSKDGKRYWY